MILHLLRADEVKVGMFIEENSPGYRGWWEVTKVGTPYKITGRPNAIILEWAPQPYALYGGHFRASVSTLIVVGVPS